MALFSSLFSLGKTRQYVLTLGEDYTVLTLVAGSKVVNAWIVSGEAEEGLPEILAALGKDTRTPVTLLADTFEQVFKDEPVPKVGRMDQSKVVRRHAASIMAANMWQGALPQGQDPRGNKLFYLFCGLPRSEHVKAWVAGYEALPNPKNGIHALPLESLSLMNALFEGSARLQGGVRWRIMTTMNVTGGLRQIVAKQGRMMLTRLTPAPPDDVGPEEAASMIARDFRQTLTYVKRLGYREGDALDLALIVDPDLADALNAQTWEAQSVEVTTPHAVGQRLGLGSVGRPEQPFGDVLHAAWFARKKAPTLTLVRPSEQKTDYQKLVEKAAPVAATVGVLGVLAGAAHTGDALWTTYEETETTQQRIAMAERARDAAQEKVDGLAYAPDLMRGTLALADELGSGDMVVLPVLEGLDDGLRNRAIVRIMTIANGQATTGAETGGGRGRRSSGREAEEQTFDSRYDLELELVDATTPEEALSDAAAVLEDVRAALPDMTVTMTRPPVAVLPDQTLTGQVRLNGLQPAEPSAGAGLGSLPASGADAEATRAGAAAEAAGGGFTMRLELIKPVAAS